MQHEERKLRGDGYPYHMHTSKIFTINSVYLKEHLKTITGMENLGTDPDNLSSA